MTLDIDPKIALTGRILLNLLMMNLIRVLHTYGTNLETVLHLNQGKLVSRQERGVLAGSGDDR